MFFTNTVSVTPTDTIWFLELDLVINTSQIDQGRVIITAIQQELAAPMLLVLPIDALKLFSVADDSVSDLRVMMAFPYVSGMHSRSLSMLQSICVQFAGRLIVFAGSSGNDVGVSAVDSGDAFVEHCMILHKAIEVWNGDEARVDLQLAGHALHPLFRQLVADSSVDYKI